MPYPDSLTESNQNKALIKKYAVELSVKLLFTGFNI